MIANKMLVTTCPECDTTFRVTEEILAKASGQVRCGRCSQVFDATQALQELEDAETRPVTAADQIAETSYSGRWILQDEPALTDDDADALAEGLADDEGDAETDELIEEPSSETEDDLAETQTDIDVDIDADETEESEADSPTEAAFEDEAPTDESSAEESAPEETPSDKEPTEEASEAELEAEAETETDADAEADAELDAEAETEAESEAEAEAEADTEAQTETDPDWLPPLDEPEPRRVWPWAAAAAVLTLVLAGQLLLQFRSELVELPSVGPVLAETYSRLDLDVTPQVDIEQYRTLDLTAVAEPGTQGPGWLIIETRIQNRGPKVQPFPYIFVTLLDRWEEAVAGRYFAPDEYLVSLVSDSTRMNVGATVDAQFIIVDPGPSATGFELEFCAPAEEGFFCESDQVFD